MFAPLAFAAIIIEAAFGYPQAVFCRIGHPVTWMGALIAWGDRAWNRPRDGCRVRRLKGIALAVLLIVVAAAGGLLVVLLVGHAVTGPWALACLAVVASALVAQNSLDAHVSAVASALERDGVDAGRRAVASIVGRDPEQLDEAGVARAAIESLAENFSDGVVAPLFWLIVAGLPGALVYKAINTADSMIGHMSERHRAFGWAAARTDDVANLPASRLAALWLCLAATIVPFASFAGAVHSVWCDARKHRSPNAGWPEAAMAGALGLRLAGPRVYGGETVMDHWMGSGRAEARAADIRRALLVYRLACLLQGLVVGALAAAVMRW
jgi:adenosylcobinamide-phosphate synthase